MVIKIDRVDLTPDAGRCRALVTARIEPIGIVLRFLRIMLGTGGKLYLEFPYKMLPSGDRNVFVHMPDDLRAELKQEALEAYAWAGGEPGDVPHDAPTSRERRHERRAAAAMAGLHGVTHGSEQPGMTASVP